MPPTPPRIRFTADNPDDWKSPDEWAREYSAATQLQVSIDEAPSAQEDESWDLIAADLREIHNQEEPDQIWSLIAADLRDIHNQEPSPGSENS
jgi:aminoglycoside phosphotransferase